MKRHSNHFITVFVALIILIPLYCSGSSAQSQELQANPSSDFSYTSTGVYITITGYIGTSSTTVRIPETIDGLPVRRIGDSAFRENQYITDVFIPEGITDIGSYAFYKCNHIKTVNLPVSLTAINNYTFYSCGLTSIDIPESITSIGEYAFYSCWNMSNVTLHDGITYVGHDAFGYMVSTIFHYHAGSSTARAIGDSHLFISPTCSDFAITQTTKGSSQELTICRYYGSNSDIILPDEIDGCPITAIGMFIFHSNQSINNVQIPQSVTTIGQHAFYDCTGLESLVLPKRLKMIYMYAFAGCGLKHLYVPESVILIEASVFENCPDLTLEVEVGSYAQRYAEENSIKYTIAGVTPILTPVPTPEFTPSPSPTPTSSPYQIVSLPFVGIYTVNLGSKIEAQITDTMHSVQKWTSSNKTIAVVDANGIITPIKVGNAKISAILDNRKKLSVKIKVVDPFEPIEVVLDRTGTIDIRKGTSLQLVASIMPESANTFLRWNSSKKKIATVSSTGMVTAVKRGTAVITVKTHNGKKAKVRIRVVEDYI